MYKILLVLLVSSQVKADLSSTYGFGSSTAALANANRAYSYDAYTVERNTALMSYDGSRTSFGIVGGVDFFSDISSVQLDSTYIGGSSSYGDVNTDVPDTLNFVFGSIWSLSHGERAWRVGVTFSTPIDKLTEPSTQDPYEPQYVMYGSDTQRTSLLVGSSLYLGKGWTAGLGAHYYLVQAATFKARMPSSSVGTPKTSTANLKATVKPSFAPTFGFAWEEKDHHRLSLNYVGERNGKIKLQNDASMGIVSPSSVPVGFDASASLFYDPETWSVGGWHVLGGWDWHWAVDYEKWSRFDGSYMKLYFRTFQGSLTQYPVDTQYRDIWVPRIGVRIPYGESGWSIGYAYRPTPVPDQSGETNFLDADRDILSTGYDFKTRFGGLLESDVTIQSHLQYQRLRTKTVTKTSSTQIGATGYKIEGYVVSYGITLSAGL